MRKLALLLGLLSPLAALGQGIITVPPQRCVRRDGDNPAWAGPNLDETGWQPYTQWKLNPDEPHNWVRCRADSPSLREAAQPGDGLFDAVILGFPHGGNGWRNQRSRLRVSGSHREFDPGEDFGLHLV